MTQAFVHRLLAMVIIVGVAAGCAEEKKKDVEAAVVSVEKLLDEHGGRLAALENGNKTLQSQLTALEGTMGELSSKMATLETAMSKLTAPPDTGPVTATELSIVDKDGKGRIKLRLDDKDKPRLILLDENGGAKGEIDLAEIAELVQLFSTFQKDPMMSKLLEPVRSSSGPRLPKKKSEYDKTIRRVGEFEYQVIRNMIDETLADLGKVGRAARIIPNYRDGKLQGYKLIGVRPGSIYRAMGIRSGDVVLKVNGKALDSPEASFAVYESLKTTDKVELLLSRRGKNRTHTYHIVEEFTKDPVQGKLIDPAQESTGPRLPSKKSEYEKGVRRVDNREYEVLKRMIDTALQDLGEVGRQARVIPAYRKGEYYGFKLIGVRPGSLYRAMDINSGDIILQINDHVISDAGKALLLFEELNTRDKVVLRFTRRGRERTQTYLIVDQFTRDAFVPEPVPAVQPVELGADLSKWQSPIDFSPFVKITDTNRFEVDTTGARNAVDGKSGNGEGWRLIPHYKDGKYQGPKVFGVGPEGLPHALGFRSGDVVRTVNGTTLDTPGQALELLGKSDTGDEIVVQIDRSRKSHTFTYLLK